MSVGEQNSRITKPFDSKHLEELAKQSAPGSAESDPRPTCKIHKDELLGLLDLSLGAAAAPPSEPTPAGSGTHARLGPASSTSSEISTLDDRETQRMQAKHFQSLVDGGLPITPALLESVDCHGEADAAAAQASMLPRSPAGLVEKLGHESPARNLAQPARSSAGLRIFITLIVLATVGFAGFLGLQIAT